MSTCHPHNLNQPIPTRRPFGIRVGLKPGDPFAKLVANDWHREHWFATERERDEALEEMSGRYLFFRPGDQPSLTFERISRE